MAHKERVEAFVKGWIHYANGESYSSLEPEQIFERAGFREARNEYPEQECVSISHAPEAAAQYFIEHDQSGMEDPWDAPVSLLDTYNLAWDYLETRKEK